MKKYLLFLLIFVLIFSCNSNNDKSEEIKSEKISETEKSKLDKLMNFESKEQELIDFFENINTYGGSFFEEYEQRYEMYFRIKRGEKEEFFIPSDENITELVEKYSVAPIEEEYLATKEKIIQEMKNTNFFKEIEIPIKKYFENAEKKISKMKEIEKYYKSKEYKKDNFAKGKILDKEFEQIRHSVDSDRKIEFYLKNLTFLERKFGLKHLKENNKIAAYKIYRLKYIIDLIDEKFNEAEEENNKNKFIVELEELGKDFKLALHQASKVQDKDIEEEKMDLEKYKSYIKEAKLSLKDFYKKLKDLKSGNEAFFETPEHNDYEFYIDNDENDKMKVFY